MSFHLFLWFLNFMLEKNEVPFFFPGTRSEKIVQFVLGHNNKKHKGNVIGKEDINSNR